MIDLKIAKAVRYFGSVEKMAEALEIKVTTARRLRYKPITPYWESRLKKLMRPEIKKHQKNVRGWLYGPKNEIAMRRAAPGKPIHVEVGGKRKNYRDSLAEE